MIAKLRTTAFWKFKLVVMAVLLLGFALRAYHLGHNQFWGDEGGQAWAAIQPSMSKMLETERNHAFAMPLDYIFSRFMSQINTNEGMMRIPSMIWGTLTIPLWFILTKKLIPGEKGNITGLLTMLMLSLSSIHIIYAQEMRFYSALGFFFTLSSILLLETRQNPSLRNWTYYIVITAVGIYFHPYAYLTLVFGGVFAIHDIIADIKHLSKATLQNERSVRFLIGLCSSAIILFLMFLPAYFYFRHSEHYLDSGEFSSIINTLLVGLGNWNGDVLWSQSNLYFYIFAGMILLGLIFALRNKQREILLFTLGGSGQIFIIIEANLIFHYFDAPRQLIHIAPILMIVASYGLCELLGKIHQPHLQGVTALCIACIIGFSAFPKINSYYLTSKSNIRSSAYTILANYHPGAKIIFDDDFGWTAYQTFDFYFTLKSEDRSAIRNSVHANPQNLESTVQQYHNQTFLVLGSSPVPLNFQDKLISLGFRCLTPNCFGEPTSSWSFSRVLVRNKP